MLSQRIYGLALGYEDLCDHEQLRPDPLLALLSGRRKLDEPLAGKSTLNRLELGGRSGRYHKISYSAETLDACWAICSSSRTQAPDQIVLDLDATDIPLHGHQPERFFHGYYDSYCYLPLYIFAGDQLLCARLRAANLDAAAGALEEVSRIVPSCGSVAGDTDRAARRLRLLPRRADGLVRGQPGGLPVRPGAQQTAAEDHRRADAASACLTRSTGNPARVFTEFTYTTRKSWARARRVVAKAEYLDKGENPRFVVTSLTPDQWAAQALYEKFYCARGEMENRIKEQMCLFADRLSTDEMKGNQLRLYLSALAYTLVEALRRLALEGHRVGPSAGGYDPAQAVQDRRPGTHQRPLVVCGTGVAASGQGVQMQAALDVRSELLDQVADQHFTHLLMAELNPLHQRTVLLVGIPVGGEHARSRKRRQFAARRG